MVCLLSSTEQLANLIVVEKKPIGSYLDEVGFFCQGKIIWTWKSQSAGKPI